MNCRGSNSIDETEDDASGSALHHEAYIRSLMDRRHVRYREHACFSHALRCQKRLAPWAEIMQFGQAPDMRTREWISQEGSHFVGHVEALGARKPAVGVPEHVR